MEIIQKISENGKAAVLECRAPIEGDYAAEIKRTADLLLSKGVTSMILDLSDAGHVASNGLSVIVSLNKRMKGTQGQFILAGMNRETMAVFSLLGFSHDCVCVQTAEAAHEMVEKVSGGAFAHAQTEKPPVTEEPSPVSEEAKAELQTEPAQVPGEPTLQEGETVFAQPLIVECEECSSFVRVHSSGQFMCPSCHVEFHVERDGTVIF